MSFRHRLELLKRAFSPRPLRFSLDDLARAEGYVDATLRYSSLYPNPKLRGEVARHYDLGKNLFLEQGRNTVAGLLLGALGPGGAIDGYNEATGYVVRGIGLGTSDQSADDADTGLVSPIPDATGAHYFALDTFALESTTYAVFQKTFSPSEPSAVPVQIKEAVLYLGVPSGLAGYPATTPDGPAGPGGTPVAVARKVIDSSLSHIPKSLDFTLTLRWRIKF